MGKRISDEQREQVLRLLAQSEDRDTIAHLVGVTPGQVSAISAHVTMGTYQLPEPTEVDSPEVATAMSGLLEKLGSTAPAGAKTPAIAPILLGNDVETGEPVFWNPDPASGITNPHVLVLGESGSGKTYAISCLLAELANQGIVSIVFDYGQGFTAKSLPEGFTEVVRLVEIEAARDGIDLNPLEIFPTDAHGPINVAQRIADTFARVYPKIGVQQHSVLRKAVLEVLADAGIAADDAETWNQPLPPFRAVHEMLTLYAGLTGTPQSRYASAVASHVSTLFFFNTLRPTGRKLAWEEILRKRAGVVVVQLKGLEVSLEKAITEFALWNFIGFVESRGPGALRCFVVLDEAHKLAFGPGTPVEKLLREGRKFGMGLILASQQPDDFDATAFSNTATKCIFQINDERMQIARLISRKARNSLNLPVVGATLSKLPRGHAFCVIDNLASVISVTPLNQRHLRPM